MKTVAVLSLEPGMILGEDVVFQDKTIYEAGTKITKPIIDKISRFSIMCVTVMEDVDFATTHFEKIRFNDHFIRFERNYNTALNRYKSLMVNFIQNGLSIPDGALLQLYYDVFYGLETNSYSLLDFLYNMMPNEDELTFTHCLNSALLAGVISDWLAMDDDFKRNLILCGFYYDIGKLRLPYQLLWKSGKLTPEEFRIIQSHPVIGYSLVRGLPLDEHVKNCVIMHHERLDGSGYPYHMQGQKIDVYARYMAIIDAYVAMASPRTYRNALTPLQILENFESDKTKFDIELLMPIMSKIADAQIGTRVQTSDEREWEVLLIHPNKLSRPVLRNADNELLDLLSNPEIKIVKML